MPNKQLIKIANGVMTVGMPGNTRPIDYAGTRVKTPPPGYQPANFKPAPVKRMRTAYDDEMDYDRRWNEEMAEIDAMPVSKPAPVKRPRSVYDEEMDYDRRWNEEMAEIEGAPTPVKYVPRKKPGFKISRPKLGEETTPNHIVSEPDAPQVNMAPSVQYNPRKKPGFKISRPKLGEETTPNHVVSEPEAPQFNMPSIGGGNGVTPVDIGTPDVPALPTAEVKAPKMSPASLGQPKRDPLFDTPTRRPSNVKMPEFKSTLDVLPELPKARKAQPLTGGEANAWRANASAALGKAVPGVAGIGAGLRGGMTPSTPAPADAPVTRPKSNRPALGSVADRRAAYAKAGQSVDAPIVRPKSNRPALGSIADRRAVYAKAGQSADAPIVRPKSNRPALGSVADRRAIYAKAGQPVDAPIIRSSRAAETRKTQEATAPVAATAQSRARSVRDITAADMRKYRKYTAAGNMNSEMDRWKTLQAMQGNRNASNKDYRAAKKRGEVK